MDSRSRGAEEAGDVEDDEAFDQILPIRPEELERIKLLCEGTSVGIKTGIR